MSLSERVERLRQCGFFPYQAEFIHSVLGGTAKRVVLIAPPGVGKNVTAAALVGEAVAANPETRCLVLCPAGLGLQWQGMLADCLSVPPCVMTAGLYRRLQEKDATQPNPWERNSTVIASYDFAKSPDRIESLCLATWTIVICDEIHQCVKQRAPLVRRLWSDTRIAVCLGLTATAQNFEAATGPSTANVIWNAGVIKDWSGNSLLRPRGTTMVPFIRTPEEKQFRALLARAMNDTAPSERAFVQQLLMTRADSSLYSIEQTLRRVAARSSEAPALGPDDRDDSAEPEGSNFAEVLDSRLANECLSSLDNITKDAKLGAAASLITEMCRSDKSSIIVFTQFRDTACYVSSSLAAEGIPTEHLTGADSSSERSEKIARAKREPCVLICTDAMAEGVDLSFAHRVVHYDLPWNPKMLDQRVCRVMTLTQTHEIEVTTLMCDDADDPEGNVMKRLAQRLDVLRTTLSGGI